MTSTNTPHMASNNKIDPKRLFERLLKADHEEEVTKILTDCDLLGETNWKPLGEIENNWTIAGNQQAEATQAVAEKIINCIDAVLVYECLKRKIDPESPEAPQSMEAAAEEFFGVKDGSLETVDDADIVRKLADRIQFVAVGSKAEPSYLIVDTGEGQSPSAFPSTFLSLAKSNKWRIPFVQGKYNAGGTGALRFCGTENYQLIVSRRAPELRDPKDPSRDLWGFTLIRRFRPTGADKRRGSNFVYLVLENAVPRFRSDEVLVLPGRGEGKVQPEPYARGIRYGTAVKLYSFRWRNNGTATLEARFALNSAMFRPVLPVRITETRKGYKANYYSTTASGGAIDDNPPLDAGPLSASIPLPNGLGSLPAEIRVFGDRPENEEDVKGESELTEAAETKSGQKAKKKRKRHSTGVVFTLNGQRHGEIRSDVIARKVALDFIVDDLLMVVDVTAMPSDLREDIWMSSRDRVADTAEKRMIDEEIFTLLGEHPALRELNNKRKQHWVTQKVDEDEPLDILQELISEDPALAEVFGTGTKLKKIIPGHGGKEPAPFAAKRFPTFFRLRKPIVAKDCPINRYCRLDFVTDAANDYFSRGREKGSITVAPPAMDNGYHLYNGVCSVRVKMPFNSKVGDSYEVTVEVNDSTQTNPFVTKIQIRVTPAEMPGKSGGPHKTRQQVEGNGVAFPNIIEVTKDRWQGFNFDDYSGIELRGGANGEPMEAVVNMDNRYFQHEKVHAKDEAEQKLISYFYKYGITILALGIVHEVLRVENRESAVDGNGKKQEMTIRDAAQKINPYLGGLASVVIPVVKRLATTASKAIN